MKIQNKEENPFLASLQEEGKIEEPLELEKEEKETPASSPEEKKPKEDETAPPAEEEKEDATQPKEGEKPEVFHAFHEHPRWITAQEELKELREFRERAEPLLSTLSEEKEENKGTIPEWFSNLFGENEDAWGQYREYNTQQRKQLREEILSELKNQETAKIEEQKKMDAWVENGIKKLEDSGYKFDRNELLQVTLKYLPSDDKGNISFDKAYEIYEGLKSAKSAPPSSKEKKEIADKTIKKGVANEEKKDYKTSSDFIGKSFADISRE